MRTERVAIIVLLAIIACLLVRGDSIEVCGAVGITGLVLGLKLGAAWKFNEPRPESVGGDPR